MRLRAVITATAAAARAKRSKPGAGSPSIKDAGWEPAPVLPLLFELVYDTPGVLEADEEYEVIIVSEH